MFASRAHAADKEGWCGFLFKDVAEAARIVLLAQYHASGVEPATVKVVEVLKGAFTERTLALDLAELRSLRLRDRDYLLLALAANREPIRTLPGKGACSTVPILPVRGGKLRARDRQDYDDQQKPMTLDELRVELARGSR